MPDWHKIKVVSPSELGRDQYVEIDGERLKGVVRVTVITDARDANRVTIEMYAKSIEAEVEAEPVFLKTLPTAQRVDEPFHEWHQRNGVERDESCYDCVPTTASEAGFDEADPPGAFGEPMQGDGRPD